MSNLLHVILRNLLEPHLVRISDGQLLVLLLQLLLQILQYSLKVGQLIIHSLILKVQASILLPLLTHGG